LIFKRGIGKVRKKKKKKKEYLNITRSIIAMRIGRRARTFFTRLSIIS